MNNLNFPIEVSFEFFPPADADMEAIEAAATET